jgi:fimbrial chaperone protein
MKIGNTADTPLTLQARAYRWTGEESQGGLISTDDIMLNPPMFTIAPGGTRYLRLGLRTANHGTSELTYRLALQEVPKGPLDAAAGTALRTILRMTIPIFALPKTAVAAKVTWSAEESAGGKFRLTAANKGNAHIQIQEFEISPAGKPGAGKIIQAAVYVLPGQSYEWQLDAPEFAGQTQWKVVASTDAGKSEDMVETTHAVAQAH